MQSKRYSALFLCLVFAMLVSTALSTLAVQRCVPGKSYFDGCNRCGCSAQGEEYCTFKLCSDADGKPFPKINAPADFWEPLDIVEPPRA